jgi:uncharacterized protein (TIGR03083 family)
VRRERAAWLECLGVARSVLSHARVRECWQKPSALAGWSVGGLAAHLIRGATMIADYVDTDGPRDAQPISRAEYWRRIPPDPAEPVHLGVRQRGEDQAARGLDELMGELDAAEVRLREIFDIEPEDRLIAAFGGAVMTLDDFLACRCVELTIHTDDLCASVGVATPQLPADAIDLSITCLVGAARLRHGDLAVLRALTRRERDEAAALRVL